MQEFLQKQEVVTPEDYDLQLPLCSCRCNRQLALVQVQMPFPHACLPACMLFCAPGNVSAGDN